MRGGCLTAAILALLTLSGCAAEDEPNRAERALEKLQQEYDELVADRGGDPVEWAAEDIENLGDWEYRVETIPFEDEVQFAEALDELGNDRWEVIWMERNGDGYRVFMKKPSISLLSKIPLSQLGRLLIQGSDAQ